MKTYPGTGVRIAELVGGLSLAADVANGYPPEKCLRTAILAVEIGRRAGEAPATLRDAYFVSLFRFLGCTAFAHEEALVYGAGDDVGLRNVMGMADATNPVGTLRAIVANIGKGARPLERTKAVARLLLDREVVANHARAQCDLSIRLATIVGTSPPVLAALAQACERYDGRGAPAKLEGEALGAPARLLHIADVLEICLHRGTRERARHELALRAGKHLDPAYVRAALRDLEALANAVDGTSVWERFLEAEPEAEPSEPATSPDPHAIALAFAHFADVKSVYTLGHSSTVAALATAGAAALGMPTEEIEVLRDAALLHDIGRVAVPNGIWDKPGPLGDAEWERVRLHTYHTERIARRAPAWANAARIAGGAHERGDGSGYHRGVPRTVLGRAEGLLAAADVLAALLEPRPHRAAFERPAATDILGEEVRAGRLDRESVDAILGTRRPAQISASAPPCGLSEREIQVLRLVARGKTNREIAELLGISPRTVQNHVAHIYDKAGVYSRAGAALFATENDLLWDP